MVGGKSNSLGRVNDVIEEVLRNRDRLEELYSCLFNEDPWVRMRAADALEKVCRVHPEWVVAYVDRFNEELAPSTQPSIQWHLAQMYGELELDEKQKGFAATWLKGLLSTTEVDWIAAANAMDTLASFTADGSFPASEMIALLKIQQQHRSKSVRKRADKLLAGLSP